MRFTSILTLAGAVVCSASAWAQDAGDPEAGARAFGPCLACHTARDTGVTKLGPHLEGVIGRAAGAVDGYRYSPSYPEAGYKGLTWNEETLFAYLADPLAYIREATGNGMARSKMKFGVRDEQKRRDIIAYLKSL